MYMAFEHLQVCATGLPHGLTRMVVVVVVLFLGSLLQPQPQP
jgi:hypothetical protein